MRTAQFRENRPGNAASALVSNALTGWIVGEAGSNIPLGYAHAMTFTAGILIVGAIAAFALIFPERTIARFAGIATMTQHV